MITTQRAYWSAITASTIVCANAHAHFYVHAPRADTYSRSHARHQPLEVVQVAPNLMMLDGAILVVNATALYDENVRYCTAMTNIAAIGATSKCVWVCLCVHTERGRIIHGGVRACACISERCSWTNLTFIDISFFSQHFAIALTLVERLFPNSTLLLVCSLPPSPSQSLSLSRYFPLYLPHFLRACYNFFLYSFKCVMKT